MQGFSLKLLCLVLSDGVIVVSSLSLAQLVIFGAKFALISTLLFGTIFVIDGQGLTLVTHIVVVVCLSILHVVGLLLDLANLSVQNEFLTLDLERLLLEHLHLVIEVFFHLSILRLEQSDMLMTGLIIVVEVTDSRLLFVFEDLLFQNFELELHKVNLLLQVNDVVILGVLVGVHTELTWVLLALILPTEVHHRGRIVASIAAEGASTTEVGSTFQRTAAYREMSKNSNLKTTGKMVCNLLAAPAVRPKADACIFE